MRRGSVRSCVAVLLGGLLAVSAALADDEGLGFEVTPPRLSLADGDVSFWRAGADDWAPAHVNTPLAVGDELYTGPDANLEIQVGPRAYLRAGSDTQVGMTNLEPDYLQVRLTNGDLSLDLRSLKASQTFEIATPNAAFTIERTGYYRAVVEGLTTTLTSRRGGRAILTLASGNAVAVAASEQVVVSGLEAPRVESYAAPELDAWDRWNYARTDSQLDAMSARYVPADIYGVADLDHYGDWRVVAGYGPLWVPRGVPAGWIPYSTGRWIYDPFYSWTWVDDFPWGWAPIHYGRWVHVSGYWGWAPGPLVVRSYYSPALVAFFGRGGPSIGVPLGTPRVGWVALGWGEPLVPWWGPVAYRSAPRWAGWAGPRIVNEVVVRRETPVRVKEIHLYQNERVRDAIVAVDRDRFGRESVTKARIARVTAEKYKPLHGELPVKPDRSSLVAGTGASRHPPGAIVRREVVARRAPRAPDVPGLEPRRKAVEREDLPEAAPRARVVPHERESRIAVSDRAPFGTAGETERRPEPPAPRFRDMERRKEGERSPPAERPQAAAREAPPPAGRRAGRTDEAQREPERLEEGASHSRDLPGEPADRVYRSRHESPAHAGDVAPSRQGQGQERQREETSSRGGGRANDRERPR